MAFRILFSEVNIRFRWTGIDKATSIYKIASHSIKGAQHHHNASRIW